MANSIKEAQVSILEEAIRRYNHWKYLFTKGGDFKSIDEIVLEMIKEIENLPNEHAK